MINRNNKKGFTIVELVIVIAVIAILAAVLIPTFSGIIRKANISADTQLAKNLNDILAAEEAVDGKPSDFEAVVQILKNNGYVVSSLNPTTSGCFFVWESDSNQIILVDGKDEYKVIYNSKDYKEAGSTWNFAIGDPAVAKEVKDYFAAKSLDVVVQSAVSDVKDLTSIMQSAKKDEPVTVYMDESLVMDANKIIVLDNPDADVTIVLGESNVTATTPLEDKIPFEVKQGTLTISGGNIASTGVFTNPDGNKAQAPVVASAGTTLNIENTVFNINAISISGSQRGYLRYQGGNGTLDNVTVTSNDMGILVNTGAKVTVSNCTFNAKTRALWSCSFNVANDKHDKVSTITVDGGTYNVTDASSTFGAVTTCGGVVIINKGTFSSENGVLFFKQGSESTDQITINDGNFVVDGKTMTFDELKASVENNNTTLWAKIAKNYSSISIVGDAIVLK